MLKKGLPLGLVNIRKIIRNAGYQVRKAKKVLTSTDPLYREKLKKILQSLKSNEKFFSIDEFGPFAVKKQGGRAFVAKGKEQTYPQWQKSKGTLIITATLELSTNQITHFYSTNKNTAEMIKLLDLLLEKYNSEERLYLSWDAASWHASKALYEKVKKVDDCKNAIDCYFKERNENFKKNPKRAGNKIWGKELVEPVFSESNNCKKSRWR